LFSLQPAAGGHHLRDTRIAGLTVLDQINHQARTMGVAAFYWSADSSGGLRFKMKNRGLTWSMWRYENSGSRVKGLDTDPAFPARLDLGARASPFPCEKSESRRERLQIVTRTEH